MFKKQIGWKHFKSACIYSIKGLKAAYKHEAGFRHEVALTLLLIPLSFWVGKTGAARALLMASWLWVLVVEILNSALEATLDCISEDYHPLIERAKDLGSAAVMLSMCIAGLVWLMVWWF